MRLGNLDITLLSDGAFYLDGGAMFGIVPKTLWTRLIEPDEKNRVRLGLNCVLVQTAKELILIDTGLGRKLPPKHKRIYGVDEAVDLLKSLNQCGLRREDIGTVILSHLHLDHAGWNTMTDESGRCKPTFPRARYIIQRGEWEAAMRPNELTKATYLPENLAPLDASKQVVLVDGDEVVTDGVRVVVTGGHTKHHQCVMIESEGSALLYIGDIMPTTHHVNLPYIMAFDHFPLDTLRCKREMLERASLEDWLIVWPHDSTLRVGRVEKDAEGKYRAYGAT